MEIDKNFLFKLLEKAGSSERLRTNYDLRTTALDGSQRMLNAMSPETVVPIHRHNKTSETVICLCGRIDEVYYDDKGKETSRFHLCPNDGSYGCQVQRGVWHTVEVFEPSVIFEAKDCAFGCDGSEMFGDFIAASSSTTLPFENSLGGLKKNIEYLIGMERQSGSMDVITPVYVSRMLNVPLYDVEATMKEMEL